MTIDASTASAQSCIFQHSSIIFADGTTQGRGKIRVETACPASTEKTRQRKRAIPLEGATEMVLRFFCAVPRRPRYATPSGSGLNCVQNRPDATCKWFWRRGGKWSHVYSRFLPRRQRVRSSEVSGPRVCRCDLMSSDGAESGLEAAWKLPSSLHAFWALKFSPHCVHVRACAQRMGTSTCSSRAFPERKGGRGAGRGIASACKIARTRTHRHAGVRVCPAIPSVSRRNIGSAFAV
eukprot:358921-Chlamydomonas_euryale.AAC.3